MILVDKNSVRHYLYILIGNRAAVDTGNNHETNVKPVSSLEEKLLNLISRLSNNENVGSILVQLLLPKPTSETFAMMLFQTRT